MVMDDLMVGKAAPLRLSAGQGAAEGPLPLTAKGRDGEAWKVARMMTTHHNGALEMAKGEQENGKNATAKKSPSTW